MYLWLVAAGLSLIFGVMRVLNFAHGSLYMLGAYFAWVVVRVTGSFWLALLIGPAVVAGVGWAMEFGFLGRVYSAPEAFQLLLTFAFVLILGAALAGLGGALSMPVRAISPGMGEFIIIEAFVVVVLGGLGSLRGAFVGALLIGLLHAYGLLFMPVFELALGYLAMAAVLIV